MSKCGDCIRYDECKEYVDKNECFPEVNGCPAFKQRKEDNNEPSSM